MKEKIILSFIILILFLSSCSTTNNSTYFNKMLTLGDNYEPFNTQYPTMRTVIYGNNRAYEFKNDKSEILAIILEGGGMSSVLGLEGKDYFQKGGFWFYVLEEFKNECSILVVEKLDFEFGKYYVYGVNARKNYTLENLITNYSRTINVYLSENNYSKVVLLGVSEGAKLLPRLYKNLPNNGRISGLVSVSGGGLSRYEEFKIFATTSQFSSQFDDMSKQLFQNLDSFKNDIRLYPKSVGDFGGLPYPWWNSFLDYRPFDDYKDINIPVLFIHGELDTNVPVESTKYVQENLPDKPFEYLIYPDADHHSFMNSKETFNDFRNRSREWLNKL